VHRVLVAITSPVHASDCAGQSPHIPWRQLVQALQPLQLHAVVVRHSTRHDSCESVTTLHQSILDDFASESINAGVTVAQQHCEPDSAVPHDACSLNRQLQQVAESSGEHDVLLLVTWQAYRRGLHVECATAGCLHPLLQSLHSFSEDASRCGGAARALSLTFAGSSCLDVAAGVAVGDFILNPSAALSVDEVSLLPWDAFRTVLRTIAADAM
jgi:hypothetical protein